MLDEYTFRRTAPATCTCTSSRCGWKGSRTIASYQGASLMASNTTSTASPLSLLCYTDDREPCPRCAESATARLSLILPHILQRSSVCLFPLACAVCGLLSWCAGHDAGLATVLAFRFQQATLSLSAREYQSGASTHWAECIYFASGSGPTKGIVPCLKNPLVNLLPIEGATFTRGRSHPAAFVC